MRNSSSPAGSYTVDTGSGTLLPLFDADTGIMVMPSKGDGSVRYAAGHGVVLVGMNVVVVAILLLLLLFFCCCCYSIVVVAIVLLLLL